ncbi:MAG TPA: CAP domain-containing protein [Mycobacteriales bacterium]|nr:CAP domain-containing protein [Mycobacteriales bacterium]
MPASLALTRARTWTTAVLALLVAVVLGPLGAVGARPAHAVSTMDGVRLNAVEARLVSLINQARTSRGLPRLVVASGATDVARRWAAAQASRRVMAHNPLYAAQLAVSGSGAWRAAAENVGVGRDPVVLFNAYMASPGHRANILDARYRYLGIGWAELPDGSGYNTQNFVDAYSTAYGPTREPAYGSLLDRRVISASTPLADFESGRDARILTAVTAGGLTASAMAYDAPTTGDQAGRFVVRQTAAGIGGGAEMRLRDPLDLSGARSFNVTIGAVTGTGRALSVNVAVRTAFGSTVNVGTMSIASGRNVTATFALPTAARGYRNEVVVHVSRASLTALNPAALTGRQATVYVRHIGAVA